MRSSPGANLPSSGPTPADCHRLISAIRKDFIPGVYVRLDWYGFGSGLHGLKAELVDESAHSVSGQKVLNVWATKTFGNQIHLFSEAQLYDLLIVGYRAIERFFEQGEAAAPTRRVE